MTRKNLGQVGSPSWPKRYLKRSRGLWSKRMDDPDFEAMFGKEVRGYPEVEGLQAQSENFARLGFKPSILQNCGRSGFLHVSHSITTAYSCRSTSRTIVGAYRENKVDENVVELFMASLCLWLGLWLHSALSSGEQSD